MSNINVFTYFEADDANIERQLHELTENYDNLSPAQVFEKAVGIFDAIKAHFNKQEDLLFAEIRHVEKVRSAIEVCLADRKKVLDDIDNSLNLHVDEPGFNESVRRVLKDIERHVELSEKQLYAEIRNHVPAEAIERINKKLEMLTLS